MKKHGNAIKFGILTAVTLILYFVFLGFLHLNTHPAFSFFNAIICATGISLAIKNERRLHNDKISYLQGFKTGVITGVIATFLFAMAFISYYSYVPGFAKNIGKHLGLDIDTGMLFLTIFIMGIASTLIVTFALMQLHKQKYYQESTTLNSK